MYIYENYIIIKSYLLSIDQTCIENDVTSKQNQDCTHKIVSSSWYAFVIFFRNNLIVTIIYLMIHLLHKLF